MSISSSSRVSLSGALGGAPPDGNQLAFDCERQTQSQWCWAAVAVSVARYYSSRTGWSQCALVRAELHRATCCEDGAACDQPWYLDRALARVGHSDGGIAAGALSFAEITAEVDAREPIGVRIGWRSGGGHFIVIEGYSRADGLVEVEDPIEGHAQMTYEALVGDYGGAGAWTHTYRTRR